jgi:proteic killer suppression protein
MIRSFHDKGTEDVFHGVSTKAARKSMPQTLAAVTRRKLDQLNQAARLDDLKAPPKNRLEALKGDRKGQHSIRINDQYRICFVWTDSGPERVEIADYH